MATKRIGIIGIGLLGSALARRLLAQGFDILGYDIQSDQLKVLEDIGGTAANSAQEVARQCQRILLCLPTSKISSEVLSAVQAWLQPETIILDMTTGNPDEMEQLAARLAVFGVHYLDCTVGGSSQQAERGELILMVGGERQAFECVKELVQAIAKRVFYLGRTGSGARMKLVFNLVLGLNRAVLAEGLAFARAIGIDPATALEVLKSGGAYSRVMDTKGTKMLRSDFTPEARLAQHHKDVRLILEQGRKHGAYLPLSEVHDRLLSQAEELGYGEYDNSAIIKVFEAMSKHT